MDLEKTNLNDEQLKAVKQIDGPLLILAGAGSGKTKTITTRLAYLISLGIDPSSTLTLTFTNKAANEMRIRAMDLIEGGGHPPLLCTFHKFGLLFLKKYIKLLDRAINFVVIDTDDKKKILKNIDDTLPVSFVANEISKCKNSLINAQKAIEDSVTPNYKKAAIIYQKYENYLIEHNLVDFDDLLILAYQILDENPYLAKEVSEKYRYIMVDEYQDTNDIQFQLLKKLCTSHNNLCVVGDDDQSIYGWRGANINNILHFNETFGEAQTIKLEVNYRSTSQILNVANTLIGHNTHRLGKVLKSHKGDGEDVRIIETLDEIKEAEVVAKTIKDLIENKKVNPKEIAVLYRINALSRTIEEILYRYAIPYKLVGAVKFYERAEIKDIISYLRVLANDDDDFSFIRIINKPKRGIGKVTVNKLMNGANEIKMPLIPFLYQEKNNLEKYVSKKNAQTIKEFLINLEELKELAKENVSILVDEIEDRFGIRTHYSAFADGAEKVANIDEFYGSFREFTQKNKECKLEDFLNDVSLQSDQDGINSNFISVMSTHASKGLEFEAVFVIGFEEGFFPLLGEDNDMEEERRLAYVAFTRAKDRLFIAFSKFRLFHGKRTEIDKSRFLSDAGLIKGKLIIETKATYKKGDIVKHKVFGIGRVLGTQKAGVKYKLNINFGGQKREILSTFVEKIS